MCIDCDLSLYCVNHNFLLIADKQRSKYTKFMLTQSTFFLLLLK